MSLTLSLSVSTSEKRERLSYPWIWIWIWIISRQGPRNEASHRRGARLWCDVIHIISKTAVCIRTDLHHIMLGSISTHHTDESHTEHGELVMLISSQDNNLMLTKLFS